MPHACSARAPTPYAWHTPPRRMRARQAAPTPHACQAAHQGVHGRKAIEGHGADALVRRRPVVDVDAQAVDARHERPGRVSGVYALQRSGDARASSQRAARAMARHGGCAAVAAAHAAATRRCAASEHAHGSGSGDVCARRRYSFAGTRAALPAPLTPRRGARGAACAAAAQAPLGAASRARGSPRARAPLRQAPAAAAWRTRRPTARSCATGRARPRSAGASLPQRACAPHVALCSVRRTVPPRRRRSSRPARARARSTLRSRRVAGLI